MKFFKVYTIYASIGLLQIWDYNSKEVVISKTLVNQVLETMPTAGMKLVTTVHHVPTPISCLAYSTSGRTIGKLLNFKEMYKND